MQMNYGAYNMAPNMGAYQQPYPQQANYMEAGKYDNNTTIIDDTIFLGPLQLITTIKAFYTKDAVLGFEIYYDQNKTTGRHVGTDSKDIMEQFIQFTYGEFIIAINGSLSQTAIQAMRIQTNQRVISIGFNFSGTSFNLAMPYMRVQAIKYGLAAQLCYIGASFTPLNMNYNQ